MNERSGPAFPGAGGHGIAGKGVSVSSAAIADAQLVRQVQEGDSSAFAALFALYQTPICTYLYRLVGNREDSYDLAQETFLKAWKALPRMGADLRFTPWLYRIATNTALSALRRRRLIRWLPLFNDNGDEQEEPVPERFPASIAEGELVKRALSQMPKDYLSCLLLHDHEGLGTEEIGEVLNLSRGAVRVKLFRARRAFREIYLRESRS